MTTTAFFRCLVDCGCVGGGCAPTPIMVRYHPGTKTQHQARRHEAAVKSHSYPKLATSCKPLQGSNKGARPCEPPSQPTIIDLASKAITASSGARGLLLDHLFHVLGDRSLHEGRDIVGLHTLQADPQRRVEGDPSVLVIIDPGDLGLILRHGALHFLMHFPPWHRRPSPSQRLHRAIAGISPQPSHHAAVISPQMMQGRAPTDWIQC